MSVTAKVLFNVGLSRTELEFSDIYDIATSHIGNKTHYSDFVIIPTDGLTINELGDLVSAVNAASPKVIAIDYLFMNQGVDYSHIVRALQDLPNVVLPSSVKASNENHYEYECVQKSIFCDSISVCHTGVVTQDIDSPAEKVRWFSPILQVKGESVNSFAVEVASLAVPGISEELEGKWKERVHYLNPIIDTIDASWVLRGECFDKIKDKIVFLGELNSSRDVFSTSVDPRMPGVMLLLHETDTIITGDYISSVNDFWTSLLALIVAVVISTLLLISKLRWSDFGNLVVRLIQIVLLFLSQIVCLRLYAYKSVYLDISYFTFITALSAISFDIIYGIWSLSLRIIKKIK